MDLIDRDVLRKKLAYMWYDNCNLTAKDIENAVFDAPTVDAEPVVHGKWIKKEKAGFLHCSNCGYIPIMSNFNYCPKCGANMDGE